jgi:hypothetical protein
VSKHEDVEVILARLMPSSLSQQAHEAMERIVDPSSSCKPMDSSAAGKIARLPWKSLGGMAAALALVTWAATGQAERKNGTTMTPAQHTKDIILLGESDRVEDMVDEGWQSFDDGSAMHAMRVQLVGESQYRDEETGILVTISEPREEIILMPVSTF